MSSRGCILQARGPLSGDDKYFTLAKSEIKENDGFCTDYVEQCPGNMKYKAKAKFANKVLMWCVI